MILTTQGLVLHTTKYAETSIVAKIFTRQLGLRSYIVKGIRTVGGKTKANLLQPLSHLELTVYNNPKKQLQYIKEMHPASATQATLPANDAVSMAIKFFMDEVLYKSLKEEEPNEALFDYVTNELKALNLMASSRLEEALRPIGFMLGTARYLGIEPMDNYSTSEPLFNLKEGRFLSRPGMYAHNETCSDYYLDATSSLHLHYCLTSIRQQKPLPQLTSKQRSTTLNNLLDYYQVHLADFKNFKSHEVLHSVLR